MKYSACGIEDFTEKIMLLIDVVDLKIRTSYNVDFMTTWEQILSLVNLLTKEKFTKISYIDDELDTIVLNSESEWIEALKVAKKAKNILRLKVEDSHVVQNTKEEEIKSQTVMNSIAGKVYDMEFNDFFALEKSKMFTNDLVKCSNQDSGSPPPRFDAYKQNGEMKPQIIMNSIPGKVNGMESCSKILTLENSKMLSNALVKCLSQDSGSPPPWFDAYMQNFKRELLNDMKLEIENRLEKVGSVSENVTNASNSCGEHEMVNKLTEDFSVLDIGSKRNSKRDDFEGAHVIQCKQCSADILRPANCNIDCVGHHYYICGKCEAKDKIIPDKSIFKGRDSNMVTKYIMENRISMDSEQSLKDPETGISFLRPPKPVRLTMDAEFLFDETVPDGSKFPSGSIFTKRWRVVNCGGRAWTKDTTLKFLWGSKNFIPSLMEVEVPPLYPGQSGSVEVQCTAPQQPGFYESHWNFVHKTHFFGHRIWCMIQVTQPLAIPNALSLDIESENLKCKEELSAEGYVDNVNSDAGQPPVLPIIIATEKEYPADFDEPNGHDVGVNTESDISSIVSVSSGDSDHEFVVVPMPPCFLIPELNRCSSDEVQPISLRKEKSRRTSASSSVIFLATPESDDETKHTDSNDVTEEVTLESERITDEHNYAQPISGAVAADNNRESQVFVTDPENGNVIELSYSSDAAEKGNQKSSAVELENETIVQILPESIVSAATMLFHSARVAFSNVRKPSTSQSETSTKDEDTNSRLIDHLKELGFCNKELNMEMIAKHNGDLARVIDELLSVCDNDWHNHRH